MALRNKDSAMNKMSRCGTKNLAPVHSRRGRECDCEFRANRTLMRSWAEFCNLPIRRDEGRVVNTPWWLKGCFLRRRKKKRGERRKREKKKKSRERERSRPWMEKRAKSEIGVERR
ncbi:hypothetical protein TNCV_696921 [Trichonephila clavipes]|nr:hypothetical protein TNCV_696921 [Trichonephila clavipes]